MSRVRRIKHLRAASRRRGRAAMGVCLHCVRSVAPDWPIALLWPFLQLSFASAFARFSRRKYLNP